MDRKRLEERMDTSGADDRVLRAKYHDWCSARVADRFLELSPEEIYALAEEADRHDPGGPAIPSSPSSAGSAAPSATHPTYRDIVQKISSLLVLKMGLPTFEQWLEAYEADPRRFEKELWEAGS